MYKRLSRWMRFFEVRMPDGMLPVLVGLAMAWQPGRHEDFWPRAPLFLAAVFLAVLFVHGSDAIVGYQKGVDRLVYEGNGVVKHEKLMVTGEVSLGEAVAGTAVVLVLLLALTFYFAVTAVWSVGVLGLVTLLFASQYSVGMNLSYRGLGEAVVASTGMGVPLAYGFVTGRLAWAPFLVGVALGLWHAAANANSNQVDHPYDRAAGRGTLAVRIGLEWHRHFVVLLLLAGWGAFAWALVTGGVPPYMALAAVLVYRHIQQVRRMYADAPLAARRLGFGTFRMLLWGLTASILLARLGPTPNA